VVAKAVAAAVVVAAAPALAVLVAAVGFPVSSAQAVSVEPAASVAPVALEVRAVSVALRTIRGTIAS